ncbi:unnamed protein product [Absidia cylindrospora]
MNGSQFRKEDNSNDYPHISHGNTTAPTLHSQYSSLLKRNSVSDESSTTQQDANKPAPSTSASTFFTSSCIDKYPIQYDECDYHDFPPLENVTKWTILVAPLASLRLTAALPSRTWTKVLRRNDQAYIQPHLPHLSRHGHYVAGDML